MVVIYVGVNLIFDGDKFKLEVYFFDFVELIYGCVVEVEFCKCLCDIVCFDLFEFF